MEQQVQAPKKSSWLTPKRFLWILLVLIWIVGILLVIIGNGKIMDAKRIGPDAEKRALEATQMAAGLALDTIKEALLQINLKDMKSADRELSSSLDLIELLNKVVPESQWSQVAEVKQNVEQAKQALTTDPTAANEALSKATALLNTMSGKSAGSQ
jgi:hypothetical protein